MPARSIRAFLFDLDGVLVDTSRIVALGWQLFATERGLTIPPEDFPGLIHGRRTREILIEYFRFPADEADRLIAAGLDDKTEMVAREGGLVEIPGAADFVRASRSLGLRLAVASSASARNVVLALRTLGLTDQFEAVITSREVKHGKPAPDPYLAAASRLGVEAAESLVFEDTLFGIASARAAGALVAAVATTLRREDLAEADLIVDDFRGLDPAELLRDLGA